MSDWHHVYIISYSNGSDPVSPVKVGISNNATARMKTLQTANPNRLILVCVFNTPTRDVALALEEAFHHVLAEKRMAGEWFDLDPLIAVRLMCENFRNFFDCFLSDDPDTYNDAVELSGLKDAESKIERIIEAYAR